MYLYKIISLFASVSPSFSFYLPLLCYVSLLSSSRKPVHSVFLHYVFTDQFAQFVFLFYNLSLCHLPFSYTLKWLFLRFVSIYYYFFPMFLPVVLSLSFLFLSLSLSLALSRILSLPHFLLFPISFFHRLILTHPP